MSKKRGQKVQKDNKRLWETKLYLSRKLMKGLKKAKSDEFRKINHDFFRIQTKVNQLFSVSFVLSTNSVLKSVVNRFFSQQYKVNFYPKVCMSCQIMYSGMHFCVSVFGHGSFVKAPTCNLAFRGIQAGFISHQFRSSITSVVFWTDTSRSHQAIISQKYIKPMTTPKVVGFS